MHNGVVLNPSFTRKRSKYPRKWITEGHKVYPNKTKTYGPSTSNFMPLRFKAPSSPVQPNQLSAC